MVKMFREPFKVWVSWKNQNQEWFFLVTHFLALCQTLHFQTELWSETTPRALVFGKCHILCLGHAFLSNQTLIYSRPKFLNTLDLVSNMWPQVCSLNFAGRPSSVKEQLFGFCLLSRRAECQQTVCSWTDWRKIVPYSNPDSSLIEYSLLGSTAKQAHLCQRGMFQSQAF